MASMKIQKETISDKNGINQAQNGTKVTITNQTSSVKSLGRTFNWAGTPAGGAFPKTIGANAYILFTHLRSGMYGSKAMVTYNGANAMNVPCSWLFAWDAPANSTGNPDKVYIVCGPTTLIETMSLDQIEMNLDNSIGNANAAHPPTKTSADAEINDTNPNTATLGANITLMT